MVSPFKDIYYEDVNYDRKAFNVCFDMFGVVPSKRQLLTAPNIGGAKWGRDLKPYTMKQVIKM